MKQDREKSQIISSSGSAAEFHARTIPQTNRPQIWIHQVSRPTLVLGSTQKSELLDLEHVSHYGYDLVKRRSGGGLVIIHPDNSVWVDVIIPPSHPLWSDDVGKAFMWVGKAWARALEQVGVEDLRVHDGPATHPELGRLLCFGSVGSGEVLSGDSKVVGLSQRRTRNGARFQGIAHQMWPQEQLAQEVAALVAGDLPDLSQVAIGATFDRAALTQNVVTALQHALSDLGSDQNALS